MPVLNKKTRMVSFRLSGVEYAAAERSCSQNGVRSVSSLARDATLRMARAERSASDRSASERSASAWSLANPAESEILIQLQHQVLCLRAELDKLNARIAVHAT